MLGLDARLVRVSNKRVLKESLSTNKLKGISRLVPWVNGVNWSETNGLEDLNLRTRGFRVCWCCYGKATKPKP
jgi:hypothetical protein